MNKHITNPLTTDESLAELSKRLERIEHHMPNGELRVILNHIETMMDKQEKMYDDLSEMKRLLLNPENGVVVRVNKNTEFREEVEEREDRMFKMIEEHNDLVKFKSNITKTLWIILSTIIGSIVMIWQRIIES